MLRFFRAANNRFQPAESGKGSRRDTTFFVIRAAFGGMVETRHKYHGTRWCPDCTAAFMPRGAGAYALHQGQNPTRRGDQRVAPTPRVATGILSSTILKIEPRINFIFTTLDTGRICKPIISQPTQSEQEQFFDGAYTTAKFFQLQI